MNDWFFSIPKDVLGERPAGGDALGEGPQPAHRRGDGVVVAVAVCPALEEARQRHGQRGGAAAHRALAALQLDAARDDQAHADVAREVVESPDGGELVAELDLVGAAGSESLAP